MHLRVADLVADLALGHVMHEAQLEDVALDLGQCAPGVGYGVAALDELVGVVVSAQQVHQLGGLVVLARGGRVERRRLVARRRLLGLEHGLDRAAERLRDLADARAAAERLGKRLGLAVDGERPLLEVAGHVERPALVAEVALELAEDRGRRVARELGPAFGLEAVDRLDQAKARDLQQVVEGLVGVRVAQGEITGQRQEALRELFAGGQVAVTVVADQKLLLGFLCVLAGALSEGRETRHCRRGKRNCVHLQDLRRLHHLTPGPSATVRPRQSPIVPLCDQSPCSGSASLSKQRPEASISLAKRF